jgi:hypothetical protein
MAPSKASRYQVQVFDTSRRRSSHHADGTYDHADDALSAGGTAIKERGVASVLIVDTDPTKDAA